MDIDCTGDCFYQLEGKCGFDAIGEGRGEPAPEAGCFGRCPYFCGR